MMASPLFCHESIFENGSGKTTLDHATSDQVKITMLDCVKETLDAFDKAELNEGATRTSAALDNVFKVVMKTVPSSLIEPAGRTPAQQILSSQPE
jgi:hypothetical protein